MKPEDIYSADRVFIFLAILCLVGGLLFGLIQPYFEKETFNKFSKTKATYWDALSSDLKIIPDK